MKKPKNRNQIELFALKQQTTEARSSVLSGFQRTVRQGLESKFPGLRRGLFRAAVFKDNERCKCYTGVSLAGFSLIFNYVRKKAERMTYWRGEETGSDGVVPKRDHSRRRRLLDLKDELLITLRRLWRAMEVELLADLMVVSGSTISRTVTTWIHILGRELFFLITWPTRQQIQERLPKAFRFFFFPKTRAIIECTEFTIQRPSLPSAQRKTFSSYKHRNTAKCLVGITPQGTFSFVSNLWTGSISDRKMVEVSGFLEQLQKGDDVIAERGFLIRDLVILRKATLNIPPFALGKQMSHAAIIKTRRIAAVRIHVERAIGRLKEFRLLSGTTPSELNPVMTLCVRIAAALCNLQKHLCE